MGRLSLSCKVRPRIVLRLLVGCICLSSAHPTFASQRETSNALAATGDPVSPQPLVPLMLQDVAALPKVSYDHGKLTIVAQDSTIGDILRAVRDQMGFALDLPSEATERATVHIGPGSTKEVLAQLLAGSRFNYVILESATDQNKFERLILTLRPPKESVPVLAIAASDRQPSRGEDETAKESSPQRRTELRTYPADGGGVYGNTGPAMMNAPNGVAGVGPSNGPRLVSPDAVEDEGLAQAPEPGTLVLFGSGLAFVALLTRQRLVNRGEKSVTRSSND